MSTPMVCSNILTLPVEIIEYIFIHLDLSTLLRFKHVCQSLAAIIQNSVRLQYKIELSTVGMDDGPPSNVTTAKRFDILKEHQSAWKSLSWRSSSDFLMLDGNCWEFLSGILGTTSDDPCTKFAFRQLPSHLFGTEQKEWSINNIGFRVEDFTFDPSQDLLVCLESINMLNHDRFRVHLRTLSSGTAHPAVPDGISMELPFFLHTVESFELQVYGEHLGILAQGVGVKYDSELKIWNWKTGQIEKEVYENLDFFSILNDQHILIGCPEYCDHHMPTLWILNLQTPFNGPIELSEDLGEFVCAFHYPEVQSTGRYRLSIHTEHLPKSLPERPFSTSRHDRLLAIVTRRVRGHVFILCIPLSALLSRIPSTPRTLSWDEWSLGSTRILPYNPSEIWVCFVYGMKLVVLEPLSVCWIFDFNQRALRRDLAAGINVDQIVTEKTVFAHNVFKGNIFTSLPYRMQNTVINILAQGVMLGEDGIVIITRNEEDTQLYRILSF